MPLDTDKICCQDVNVGMAIRKAKYGAMPLQSRTAQGTFVPHRPGTPIRFKGSSKKPKGSASNYDRQVVDARIKRKQIAVHNLGTNPSALRFTV